jgi:cell wall-associated NlpC family hydrolase
MTSRSYSGEEVLALARTYIGTPWKHLGRTRQGIDCVGLPISVGKELGLHEYPDDVGYRRLSLGADLIKPFAEHCDRISDLNKLQSGDILIMRDTLFPQHVVMVANEQGRVSIIHATVHRGAVVEESFTEDWRRKIITGFRFKGLSNG